MLSYQLTMANAKVSVGKLPECVADRLAMEQIMTNLLGNAMKFRDPPTSRSRKHHGPSVSS